MSYFIELLRAIWNRIKRFFVKVLNFVKNIVSFFKNPRIFNKLVNNNDLIAVSIKEKLNDGNFRVVNCLYDEITEDVTDIETETIGIEAENLDKETKRHFGNKDMIVLN